MYILLFLLLYYMAWRNSSGKYPCKSIAVIVKIRASLSSTTSEKDLFSAPVPYYIDNISLCQIVLLIFLSLGATFTCLQQITIYSSKYFLVDVWIDCWECNLNFIFKCWDQNLKIFNLGNVEIRAQVPIHNKLALSYF
jgi:hypothetical protein